MPIFAHRPPTSGNEERVRDPISHFLRGLVPEDEIEGDFSIEEGRCDIVLPKARLVIETKAPRVNCRPDALNRILEDGTRETQFQQLERYVTAFRKSERQLELFAAPDTEAPWVGVLTNGRVWWAWEWIPSAQDAVAQPIEDLQGLPYSADIDEFLQRQAARESGKPWIPANPADAFRGLRDEFAYLCENPGDIPALATQRTVWRELIKGSGLPVAADREQALYQDHVFLLAVSRAVAGLFQPTRQVPARLLSNSYGSWVGDTQLGRQWLKRLVEKVASYNWRARPVDVLRRLYHSIIPKEDRKLYGEYYTPDWLAEMICEEMLDDEWLAQAIATARAASGPPAGIGVLDPTCGSGTFLYHAARRIVDAVPRHVADADPRDQSEIAAWLITGIDIHPVAVEMARATLLRALPDPRRLDVAVYQGDALLVNRERGNDQMSAFGENEALIAYPPDAAQNVFSIPYSLLDHENMSRRLQRLVDSAKNEEPLPRSVLLGLSDNDAQELRHAHRELTEIIAAHGNGVWTWYIRNQLAPQGVRRRRVDRIVSNPPWLRFNEIQVQDRKTETREMAEGRGLWPRGRANTSFDIAALFVVETRNLYLADGGRGAYVLNAAALRAKNWERFRAGGHATGDLDLNERHSDGYRLAEKPFGGAQACVVGLSNEEPQRLVLTGEERLSSELSWTEAARRTRRIAQEARPPWAPSEYLGRARNGATIFPAVLVRVDPDNPNRTLQPTRAKKPWKNLPVFDISDIPEEWRRPYLESHNLEAFQVIEPLSVAIVPMAGNALLSDEAAYDQEPAWRRLATTYRQHCGIGAGTPKNLIARINHGKGWIKQFPPQPSVVYNASGQVLRAAVAQHPIEHKMYRIPFDSAKAAHYVCAMLNARCLRGLYERARDSGRHFDKTPLSRLPIPRYDKDNADHQRLSLLSQWLHANDPADADQLEEVSVLARRVILGEEQGFEPFLDHA